MELTGSDNVKCNAIDKTTAMWGRAWGDPGLCNTLGFAAGGALLSDGE